MVNEDYHERTSRSGVYASVKALLDTARENLYDAGIPEPQATSLAAQALDFTDPLQIRVAQEWRRGE